MRVFHDLNEWQTFRSDLGAEVTLGFVPTMGNLHAGHASLLAQSKSDNEFTIASIFVNPTQFNQPDDFTHYPRTLDADLTLLKNLQVNYCFLPDASAMYSDNYRYTLVENDCAQLMEGKHRPGHFNGVLTVVMKLLNLVKPTSAYFGEKDYQQYVLIRDMVAAFFMGIAIKPCPTIREPSGLACSSRNNRLTPDERVLADKFATLFHQQDKTCTAITKEIQNAGITVEYLLEHEGRRFAAVVIGAIRLIDNYAKAYHQ